MDDSPIICSAAHYAIADLLLPALVACPFHARLALLLVVIAMIIVKPWAAGAAVDGAGQAADAALSLGTAVGTDVTPRTDGACRAQRRCGAVIHACGCSSGCSRTRAGRN